MSRLEELKEEFERSKKGPNYRRGSRLNINHFVTAPLFIKQLERLAIATCDVRFTSALEAIGDCKLLTASGGWKRDMYYHMLEPWYQEWDDRLFLHVATLQQEGCSFRLACAEAVVALQLNAHSFDAAMKYAERVCRSYRKSGLTFEEVTKRLDRVPETMMEHGERHWAIQRHLDRLAGRPERPEPPPLTDEEWDRRVRMATCRLLIEVRRGREARKKLSNDT